MELTKGKKILLVIVTIILGLIGALLAVQLTRAAGSYNAYLPVAVSACPPAEVDEGSLTNQPVCGPAIVEWFQASSGACGIFKIDNGNSFVQDGLLGFWWRLSSQQELNDAYPIHLDAYFAKPENAECIEGQPTSVPTETPEPTNTPTETATPGPSATPTATTTVTPTPTATPPEVIVIKEGPIAGVTIDGPAIVEWFHAASGSCGITTLDADLSVNWGNPDLGDAGYHWQFSSQEGMEWQYVNVHRPLYAELHPDCLLDANPPGWDPQ